MFKNLYTKKCKICGGIFTTSHPANSLCSDACKKIAEKISAQKTKERYKQKTASAINKVASAVTDETKTTGNNSDVVIETLNKTIIDNLELLDAVRDELLKVTNELKARQSAFDQKDFDLLHAMEGTNDDAKLLELAKLAKVNRNGRRDYKNYIKFLSDILRAIPQNSVKAFASAKDAQNYRNIFYSIKY